MKATDTIPLADESWGTEEHSCPFAEDMNDDYDTMCTCDAEATRECALSL